MAMPGGRRDRERSVPVDEADPQVQQDIDAARQMSRARTYSAAGQEHYLGTSGNSSGLNNRSPLTPRGDPGTAVDPMDILPEAASPSAVRSPRHAAELPHRMATSPGATRYSRSPEDQRMAARQAASARFYQHNRHGSNTSLDSASHFIDHRHQQLHSLTPGSFLGRQGTIVSPGGVARSPTQQRSGLARSPTTFRPEEGSSADDAARRRSPQLLVDVDDAHEDDHTHDHRDVHDLTRTPQTMSRRNSALEDDVCFPMTTPGEGIQHDLLDEHARMHFEEHDRHDSHVSGMHPGVHAGPGGDRGVGAGAGMSHANHRHPPGFPYTFDLSTLEEYASEEKERLEAAAANAPPLDRWGMRNRSAPMGAKRGSNGPGAGDAAAKASGAAYGISPDSDDATFYSRRPRKFVPADQPQPLQQQPTPPSGDPTSPSVVSRTIDGTNKYQRKLALFEGSGVGSPPPPVGARAHTIAATQSIPGAFAAAAEDADDEEAQEQAQAAGRSAKPWDNQRSKLPGGRAHSMSGGGLDAKGRRRSVAGYAAPNVPGGPKPFSGADKPYRFTFYSNALPSTIHARYLSEIPAPGQSFEELLSGLEPGALQPPPVNIMDEDEDDKARDSNPTTAAGSETTGAGGPGLPRNGRMSGGPSALAAQLAATGSLGRREGNTAPPTGANTPDLAGPGSRFPSGALPTPRSKLTGASASAAATAAAARNALGNDVEPEANTWWLDVLSPTDQEMKLLSRVFGIHPLTTEDILLEETREKIELFRNYYLVCFRSFDQDPYSPTYLEPLNCYIIVFREGTLSFHFRATPHPMNVRRRIKQLKDYINVTSDWISYALIDDITDAFAPLIQSIEYEVDAIDELVLILKEAEQSDMLRRIGTCRKKVMGLLRLMGNKADVVKGLAKRSNEQWSVAPKSDIGLYLSDIQDHLLTSMQNLTHFEAILSRSHSTYLAQISIEMTDANNQINDVLSKLTALGTVIVPMNVITGLWGMNVNVPWQGVESLVPFGGIVAVMGVLAIVGYIATVRYLSR